MKPYRPLLGPAALTVLTGLAPLAHGQTIDQALSEVTQSGAKAGQSLLKSSTSGGDSSAAPASNGASSPANAENSRFLGKDVPFLDPDSEVLAWDGKIWKVTNNRIFRARFEKYLNAAELDPVDSKAYEARIDEIIRLLTPAKGRVSDPNKAWEQLPLAAGHPLDARLCDALAGTVYNAWMAQKQDANLIAANRSLEKMRENTSWNAQISVDGRRLGDPPPKDDKAAAEWVQEQQMKRSLRMQPYLTRLAELEAMIKANQVKREVTELQSKIEFQSLILQFFFQRRFRHVLVGAAFYRSIFNDGDLKLRVGSEAEQMIQKYTGVPPTISVLESLAHEAIQDVKQGVEAYHFLLEKNELASASDRLAEAYAVGENLREIRDLSREDKRRCLEFIQKSNQMLSALEVKDYARAEELVESLRTQAKDFDPSKPLAAIQTAKTLGGMLLEKARAAALSGDRESFEKELKSATEIWPRNPKLVEVSSAIFNQADVQQQALVDLDRLISQKNFRQIFEDRIRFIVATASFPDRAKQLGKILEDMQTIEGIIIRGKEAAKMGDHRGAWEAVEKGVRQHPGDPKLNELRAELTTEAAEYVRALRTARQLEDKGQLGSSLSWYLKAQNEYPPSEFAREGLDRLVSAIMESKDTDPAALAVPVPGAGPQTGGTATPPASPSGS